MMPQDDFFYDMEPIEGYCMRCRESIEMEEARAVWTRKGQPATRGICPICAGTVFRMGKTDLHQGVEVPEAIQVGDDDKRRRGKLSRDTVYVNYSSTDEEAAQQIAADLERSGLAVWLHETQLDQTAWASGVHPALKECARMVLVLSGFAAHDSGVSEAWQFFKAQRKPIVIAQVEEAAPPDPIRRSPRFDFRSDYKRSLRQMLDALSS